MLSCANAEEAPQITSTDNATFTVGQEDNTFTVTATGDPAPSLGYSGDLPYGTSFQDNGDGTATISGCSPSSGGFYEFTIRATTGRNRTRNNNFP